MDKGLWAFLTLLIDMRIFRWCIFINRCGGKSQNIFVELGGVICSIQRYNRSFKDLLGFIDYCKLPNAIRMRNGLVGY